MKIAEASTGGLHRDTLPAAQRRAMDKAAKLAWITIVVKTVTIFIVASVSGQSQAMKTAWYEDTMTLLPPLAFLMARRRVRKKPSPNHPYGHHRSVIVGHLVAAGALLAMGTYLMVENLSGLIAREKPPIGITVLFGHAVWMGWIMIVVMALSAIPPVLLGRAKLKLTKDLHDKVLYADADMNKADWMTGVATIVGILGVGVGWWWADAAAAVAVSFSVIHDGASSVRRVVRDFTDSRPTEVDGTEQPLIGTTLDTALARPWVTDAGVRMRDLGHVYHVELFVVPDTSSVSLERLQELQVAVQKQSYMLHDVSVIPTTAIPDFICKKDV